MLIVDVQRLDYAVHGGWLVKRIVRLFDRSSRRRCVVEGQIGPNVGVDGKPQQTERYVS